MSKFKLQSKFSPFGDQPRAIATLVAGFQKGKKEQVLLGVTGSGKTFSVANVIQQLGKKTLVLAPNKTLAAQLFAEFKEFFPDNAVEYFVSYYDYYQPEAYVAATDTYIEKDSAINDEIDRLRHSATRSLLEREDVIVVASVSCIYGLGDKDDYAAHRIELMEGEDIERDELLKKLVGIQYQRNDMSLERGTFRVRGEIVEIMLPHDEKILIRLHFFGDTVEEILFVDPLRGNILRKVSNITIYPSGHYVVGQEKLQRAQVSIKEELRERLSVLEKENKLVEKQRLEQRTMLDLEMLEEMGMCPGIENYSRHLTGRSPGEPPPTLVDFFEKDFLLVVDESHIALSQVRGMYEGDFSRKKNLVDYGFRLPSALDNRPLQFKEFEERLDQILYVSATPGDLELQKTQGEFVEQIIRPTGLLDPKVELRSATYQVDDMLVEAKKTIAQGFRVLITTLTKKLAEELTSYYLSLGLKVKYLHADIDTLERIKILNELREKKFDILVGINLLREGIDLPEVALIGILDADKEGYLRSTRSLIQIIGRAARNAEGRVLLYAYKETKSIQQAMAETNRRRQVQEEYNQKHGITPQTIIKAISGGVIDYIRSPQDQKEVRISGGKGKRLGMGAPTTKEWAKFKDVEKLDFTINELRQKMKKAAKEMRFEEAAEMRDEIKRLSDLRLLF